MKRRKFLAGAAGVSTAVALNNFSTEQSIKVGVISSLFNFSGYSKLQLPSIVEYTSHKDAYADLNSGKIDALISSPGFLAGEKPEFSLLLFPADAESSLVEQNYSLISAYHAAKGFSSKYLGTLSPLMVRISNLSMQELGNWSHHPKKISIAASGSRAVWFDHLGFNVRSADYMSRLTAQLADISMPISHLDVSDAFPPALFLQSIYHNAKYSVPTVFSSNSVIVVDSSTKGPVPVEIVFKGQRTGAIEGLQKLVMAAINKDHEFQNASLALLQEQTGLPVAQSLPAELLAVLNICKDTNLKFISSLSPSASDLVSRFNSHRRA